MARKSRDDDLNLPLTVRLLVAFNPLRWSHTRAQKETSAGAGPDTGGDPGCVLRLAAAGGAGTYYIIVKGIE